MLNVQVGTASNLAEAGEAHQHSSAREADLSGAASATLSFSYLRTAGGNGGNINVEVSNNGGTSWTTLQTYAMNGSDASHIPQSFDITVFIAANTQVQFVRSGNVKRFLLVDNIDISWN